MMSLVLGLGLLVASPLDGHAAAHDICTFTALLVGEGAPVAAVGSALRRRGIQNGSATTCSALRVTVARCPSGLKVQVLRPAGRAQARVVATADTAAVLIESWLRTDIAAPLLAARVIEPASAMPAMLTIAPPASAAASASTLALVPTPVAAPAPGGAPGAAEPASLVRAAPATVGWRLAPAVALLGEAALVRDGSHAFGAGLTSCVNLRLACIGISARLARVSPVGNDASTSRGLGGAQGYDGEGLAFADVGLGAGRITFRPGAGVGVGWLGTRGTVGDRSADHDAVGVRAEARLALDWRLARGLALELALAGGAGSAATLDKVTTDGHEATALLSRLSPVVRAGLGLRYGAGTP